MKKQKTNKVKTVVYLIHFILIDIWARNGVLHIFLGGWWCFFFFVCVCVVIFLLGGGVCGKMSGKTTPMGSVCFFLGGNWGKFFEE